MKLITEYMDNIEVLTENNNGQKQYFIEGVFMQTEQTNRNGRIYEMDVLRPAVEKYITEQVKSGRAVGELNHPETPTVNLDRASHRIIDLRFEGNDVIGKALILNTPMGQIVKGLLDGGVKLGVSSRGMGSLSQREGNNYVNKDFILNTVDIVQDPSAPNAFVNGIMEGVDWVNTDHGYVARQIEKAETEAKHNVSEQLDNFTRLLSELIKTDNGSY